ncbi:hypothetical protein [Nonomuraea basaltis]|uniref:hypothetical protein n=1 Tax=Nonomuraea basaltis TaxID=2495887 RepID=UPI00110C69F0|nr:hypothetical protein [Nonomuraea basaltis]TMR90787.1 hypothetical protein EJK15_53470 [Nonomuraea basaltis]
MRHVLREIHIAAVVVRRGDVSELFSVVVEVQGFELAQLFAAEDLEDTSLSKVSDGGMVRMQAEGEDMCPAGGVRADPHSGPHPYASVHLYGGFEIALQARVRIHSEQPGRLFRIIALDPEAMESVLETVPVLDHQIPLVLCGERLLRGASFLRPHIDRGMPLAAPVSYNR